MKTHIWSIGLVIIAIIIGSFAGLGLKLDVGMSRLSVLSALKDTKLVLGVLLNAAGVFVFSLHFEEANCLSLPRLNLLRTFGRLC